MKLFLIERTDCIDYYEYDSFVVRAENDLDIFNVIAEYYNKKYESRKKSNFQKTNTIITELLPEGEREIILGSFSGGD